MMRRLLLAVTCLGSGVLASACGAELVVWTIGYYSSPPFAIHDGRPVTVERVPPERRILSDSYSVLAPAGGHWALIGGVGAPSDPGTLFFVRDPAVRRAFEPVDVATGGVTAASEVVTAPNSTPRAEAGAMLSGCTASGCRFVDRMVQNEPGSGCARYRFVYVVRTGSDWPLRLTRTTRAGRVCGVPGAPGTFIHLWYREDQAPNRPSRHLAEATRFFDSLQFGAARQSVAPAGDRPAGARSR